MSPKRHASTAFFLALIQIITYSHFVVQTARRTWKVCALLRSDTRTGCWRYPIHKNSTQSFSNTLNLWERCGWYLTRTLRWKLSRYGEILNEWVGCCWNISGLHDYSSVLAWIFMTVLFTQVFLFVFENSSGLATSPSWSMISTVRHLSWYLAHLNV